jgi:hypothetical protein
MCALRGREQCTRRARPAVDRSMEDFSVRDLLREVMRGTSAACGGDERCHRPRNRRR